MGNTIKKHNHTDIIEYCNQIKQECDTYSKNRGKLKEILIREWVQICIMQTEKKLYGYHLTPIKHIIDALDIEEVNEEYTKFLTKWNSNKLDGFDFYIFNEYINNINITNIV